ncbi:hypothetical protein CKO12_13445 [Chromatium okenii]|jgi:hypothetical protein|uniref:hypothetical protein n=1 Tax=Chromatium okenii TaxID=61644 RepID=UPI00190607D5|nr:hypothetical protein [Chromatium okenii]MBK1642855.1 hypothetical protein [Chromatium okenii]
MTTDNKRVFNLAYGKKYQAADHTEKKMWIQVGRLTIEPESKYGERISVRLDSLPIDPEFNGMLSAFPYEPRNGSSKNPEDNIAF